MGEGRAEELAVRLEALVAEREKLAEEIILMVAESNLEAVRLRESMEALLDILDSLWADLELAFVQRPGNDGDSRS